MDRLKLVLLVAALTLPVSSTQALEWVDYDGTIPDNAVSVNEGTEDRPVCRKNSRIGIVNDSGKCYSVKVGGSISKKTQDDGYQILVDESATEDTEDTYTADEYAAATEGMYTQDDLDGAVTLALDGLYTQAEYDAATDGMISQDAADELVEAAAAAATEGMYTQAEVSMYADSEFPCDSIEQAGEGSCWDRSTDARGIDLAAQLKRGLTCNKFGILGSTKYEYCMEVGSEILEGVGWDCDENGYCAHPGRGSR